MASRSLFETVAGYEEPAGATGAAAAHADDDTPVLLGAGSAATIAGASPDYLWSERSEDQFERILDDLAHSADNDPAFAQKLADGLGVEPDPVKLRAAIEESKAKVRAARMTETLGAGAAGAAPDFPALLGIPADFSDRYIREHIDPRYWEGLPRIDLEPKLRRFQDDDVLGLLGWLVFNGPEALAVPRSTRSPFREQFGRIRNAQPFRRHGTDQFVHRVAAPDGHSTRIALFADFGTGLGHARFVARQIMLDRFEAAIHLGDVYYTGTPVQYREHFELPLDPVLDSGTQLFVIPDNHDGYSGFHAYCDYLDRRLAQRGSYFAIETPHVQLIGVDTIWHGDRGRIEDAGVCAWLDSRLTVGRQQGLANVLLTGHEPYAYGSDDRTDLNRDVVTLAQDRVDLWFWGNTHYCALFDHTAATPYYGSCIGHAGYPYKRLDPETRNAAPVLFAEHGRRYEGTDVRTDRGMNGYCALEIDTDGAVQLAYTDWRGKQRCIARFAKEADGALRLAGPVEDRTGGPA